MAKTVDEIRAEVRALDEKLIASLKNGKVAMYAFDTIGRVLDEMRIPPEGGLLGVQMMVIAMFDRLKMSEEEVAAFYKEAKEAFDLMVANEEKVAELQKQLPVGARLCDNDDCKCHDSTKKVVLN